MALRTRGGRRLLDHVRQQLLAIGVEQPVASACYQVRKRSAPGLHWTASCVSATSMGCACFDSSLNALPQQLPALRMAACTQQAQMFTSSAAVRQASSFWYPAI